MTNPPASSYPRRAPELCLEDIVKVFGKTRALDRASLAVRPGSVHALLGENGAGKTTLMRVAFGLIQPDDGEILLDRRQARFRSPADAIRAGVAMVHQHFTNVPAMTAAENVALGGHGLYSPAAARERVRALAEEVQLAIDPNALAGSLSIAAQQKLEILKALDRNAAILILDEPTAVLAPSEARELLRLLRQFTLRGGSVVLITHKLSEALQIADDVTVLRYGRTVYRAPADNTSADQLAAAMLGGGRSPSVPITSPPSGEPLLRMSGVTLIDSRGLIRLADASLEVRAHEIVGVAGLENSGHEVLLRIVAGRTKATRGKIWRGGSTALIPEDRQRDALVSGFSLTENLALKGAARRRGRMLWKRLRNEARKLVAEYDVRTPSVDARASELSGGNQQKLVLARELSDQPSIIVAENPTRGLDIRASAAVHGSLREAAARGAAVLVHSSDLDEVLSLATRVVAVHDARLAEVPNEREAVGRAMLGLR
jgi:general nucleoside transport system ATP-binding protein